MNQQSLINKVTNKLRMLDKNIEVKINYFRNMLGDLEVAIDKRLFITSLGLKSERLLAWKMFHKLYNVNKKKKKKKKIILL